MLQSKVLCLTRVQGQIKKLPFSIAVRFWCLCDFPVSTIEGRCSTDLKRHRVLLAVYLIGLFSENRHQTSTVKGIWRKIQTSCIQQSGRYIRNLCTGMLYALGCDLGS